MKNFRLVPIPELMKDLKIDKRGFPIPYVVLIDKAGVAQFKINEHTAVEKCLREKLCSICGNKLHVDNTWLVGGNLSAFHPQGAYLDTPVHQECGHYALQVCPYMAFSQYKPTEIDKEKIAGGEAMQLFDFTVDMKYGCFVFIRIAGYTTTNRDGTRDYIHPIRPYSEIEFWFDGKKLSREEGLDMCYADVINRGLKKSQMMAWWSQCKPVQPEPDSMGMAM